MIATMIRDGHKVISMPSPSVASTLTSATLLAAAGGLLDAVVYLNHGHVFANAMTGNVIFLGIAFITRDWAQILPHCAPIVAFLLGVAAARLLSSSPSRNGAVVTLGVEIVALFGVGLLPADYPQLAFTVTIAFVSAFQVTTFRRVGRFTYNSTFVTGNLRDMAEGLYDYFRASDPEARSAGVAKAGKLGLICCAFLAGAALGGFVAPRFPGHAVWFAEPMLLAVLSLTLWQSMQRDSL
jgi:uncharacterized membrane protein YoaK (UPF0700 family)